MNTPGHSRMTHPRRLRIGLFGCGKMGLQHLRVISSLPDAVVVGIADPALDRDAVAGLVAADVHICDDPAELIERTRPEVVHVVTPPATHAALAQLAIRAGCHVYIEKPFAPTKDEAASVLRAAAERGVTVCAGHQYLFERPALMALECLPSIGSLVHVESYFSFRMVRRTITAVDQLNDILPHAVYPVIDQLTAGSAACDEPLVLVGVDAHPGGDVHALVRRGSCAGVIIVTLNGRPIEQYQQLVGTNGCLRADYVTGSLTRMAGPGTGPGMLFTPYRRALQTLTGATNGFARRIFARETSYPGLHRIISGFYSSILLGTAPPLSPRSILETVDVCEQVGRALDAAERRAEAAARSRLESQPVVPVSPALRRVLVTGGTGLLGRRVARELRDAGFAVRAVSRRLPRFAARLPGVEYVAADLAKPLDPNVTNGVGFIVHSAAETAGGKSDHERNSIRATRNVLEAAARIGAKVIHISSLAVLKPGRLTGGALDESSPVDAGNLERGPYVWGKAESEVLAQRLGRERGIPLAVIRPGPLVDYEAFQAPGRLGREIGPLYVAIGGRKAPLSVCDVGTAARVIRSYVQNFDSAPRVLNLVEAPPPTRGELVRRLCAGRADLRCVWVPAFVLRAASGPLKVLQRLALGSTKPIDIHAAFASERYRTSLAEQMIERAGPTTIGTGLGHEIVRSA